MPIHPTLDDSRLHAIRRELLRRPVRSIEPTPALTRAAVALVLRPASADLEILLIERPISETDPWSGHMALPGGRGEPGEESVDTAIREAHEEVGLDLRRSGVLLGRLDDLHPSRGGPQIAVSPFVFAVAEGTPVTPDPAEVAQVIWIPLDHLADPRSAAEHLYVLPGGDQLRFPALAYHRHIIWGLTYRMLIQFLGIARAAREAAS